MSGHASASIPGYHDLTRPEILALIPPAASRILDFGCGTGALGAALKKRAPCYVAGIDSCQPAIDRAQHALDYAGCYDLNFHTHQPQPAPFDTFVFADILEHLYDPAALIRRHLPALHPAGLIVASIPNIAHPSIPAELNRGLFRYSSAGILDRSHVRFFTMTSVFQMFASLDLKIISFTPVPSPTNPIQFLVQAIKSPYYGKYIAADIVIPCCSQVALLKRALTSITLNSPANVRIIVVNNGLSPAAFAEIASLPHVLEIRSAVNHGFPIGINLGLAVASAPYCCICNDDIIVSADWITHMMATAAAHPTAGIVGPITNRISGPQQVPCPAFQSIAGISSFASRVMADHHITPQPLNRLVFFCALLARKLIDKVGHLDERFSPGNFEDDDYCLRSLLAGFTNIKDSKVFVYHECSQSWSHDRVAFRKIMEVNYQKFLSKWGKNGFSVLRPSS